MTKSQLIESIAGRMQAVPKKDLEAIVDLIFNFMASALARDERIEIRGLGAFNSKIRSARQGRNPKNGAIVAVPVKRTPFFKVGRDLKERVDLKKDKGAPTGERKLAP